MRPEVRAGAGSLAPLGRLWVGEGRRSGEGVGWSQPQRGGWGWGLKDVGWRFPALCTAGWGPQPPPSWLLSPWVGSDTLTQKQTEGQKGPLDFVHRG